MHVLTDGRQYYTDRHDVHVLTDGRQYYTDRHDVHVLTDGRQYYTDRHDVHLLTDGRQYYTDRHDVHVLTDACRNRRDWRDYCRTVLAPRPSAPRPHRGPHVVAFIPLSVSTGAAKKLETALQAEVARYRGEPLLTILNELTHPTGTLSSASAQSCVSRRYRRTKKL